MATGLNEDEILQILKIVDESNVDELSIETGDLKLILKKSGGTSSIQAASKADPQPMTVCPAPPIISVEKAPVKNRKDSAVKTPAAAPIEEGLVPIKAPVLGIFYRAPSPGATPFVEEGSPVTENDIVCTIEVMKVFNSVSAGVRGVVAQVCVENGSIIEYGETLFLIRPKGESKA